MKKLLQKVLGGSLLNPASWIGWAAVIAAGWLTAHLLGWRSDTAIICGTVDPAHGSAQWVMLRGMFYAVTYFAALTAGPILVLAAVMYVAMVLLARRVK